MWCVLSVRVLMECVCVGEGESCDCVIASVGALIVEGHKDRELSLEGLGRKPLTSDRSPPWSTWTPDCLGWGGAWKTSAT